MAVIENSKIAIVGAGAVGTSLAYAALLRESAREIALYDIRAEKVEAEVLDLAHGTAFTGASRITGGADLGVVHDANVVIITAGAKQEPGQSRLDLAGANVEILRSLMPALVEQAPDAVFVLVTNPCDVLTVAARQFGGLPTSRVFSSGTVLDTSRLRWLLAERAGVATSSVHAMIVGEHGDTEFPLWSQSRIGPIPIREWTATGRPPIDQPELDRIADDVMHAAYKVIAGKGATNYAIGVTGARIAEAILRDERAILPVSSILDGYLGVSGVALSVPTIVDSSGIAEVLHVPFDADEERRFHESAEVVSSAIRSLSL